MEPRNCRRCGRLFLSAGAPDCPSCLEADEETFDRIRLYLIENPGANLDQVSKGTGVPPETVLRFLREGRLQAAGRGEADRTPEGVADRSRVYLYDLLRQQGRDPG